MKRLTICVLLFLCEINPTRGQATDFSHIDFDRADSIASSLKGERLPIDKLVVQLTGNLDTKVEKIRAIYKWIADNIEYDVVEFHKMIDVKNNYALKERKKLLKPSYSKNISKKTLKKGKAICYGYSYLFKEMASAAGIQSHLVSGYTRNRNLPIGKITRPDHAWNIVHLNDKYYLIDVTWSSGYTNKNITNFTQHFNDAYFLTDPKVFILNHYPEDIRWALHISPISLREFFNAPFILQGFFDKKLNRFAPEKGIIRTHADSTVQLFFTSNDYLGLKNATVRFLSVTTEEEITKIPVIRQNLVQTDLGYTLDVPMPPKGRYKMLVSLDSSPTLIFILIVN